MLDLLSTPVDTDIAFKWIGILFPESSGASTPYGAAFAVFTGMLTFFGSLFLAWHVIQGIVLSAYTGKVLGERFHQIWAPLRVVLGFGLLVPVSGGFSSIHVLLRDVVGVAAVQMGNAPIKAYISAITEPDEGKNVNIVSVKGRFVFDYILDKEVCNAVHNGLTSGIWASFWGSVTFTQVAAPGDAGGVSAGGRNYVYDYGSCGSLTFTVPDVPDHGLLAGADGVYDNFAKVRKDATDEMLKTIRKTFDKEGLGEYFANHDVREMETDAILKAMRTEGLVPANLAEVKDAAAEVWNKKVAASSAAVYKFVMDKNGKALTDNITKYGFMAAGGFERALTKASSITVSLANASPKQVENSLSEEYLGPYMAAKNAVLSTPRLTDESKGDGSMAARDGSDPMSGFWSFLAPSIASMKAGTVSESGDPIGDMISFGHNLLGIWEGALIFLGLAKVALIAAEAGAMGAAQTAVAGWTGASIPLLIIAKSLMAGFDFMYGWLWPILTVVLIVGILHAFVLPMLPMIMVFVMGISWLIMFLEAAIAGVLWAFAFIRMDGQEMFDKNQSPGVTLLFNLFLRPAIGMLAFIGGLMLLPEVMNSLSILWDDNFNAQTSPDWSTILQWIVGIVMYTWMQWHLSLRIFGLIPTIADRVGHWMGFGATHGYNDGQETSAAIGAAVAAGQVGRTLQRRQKMPQQKKEKAENNKGKDDKGGDDGK